MGYDEAKSKTLELSISVQKVTDPKIENTGVTIKLTLKQLLLQMVETEGGLFRRTGGAEGIAPRTVEDYLRYAAVHYGTLSDLPVWNFLKQPDHR
jgi:hypothetical protein